MDRNVSALEQIKTLIRERYQAVLDMHGTKSLPYAEAQRMQRVIYHDLVEEGIIETIVRNASRQS